MTVELQSLKLKFNFSFFAVLSLMLLLADGKTAVLCFFSSMLHETGHLIFMRIFSCGVKSVEFGAAGIAIESGNPNTVGYKGDFFIAMGGIIANSILCLISLCLFFAFESVFFEALFFINGFIALLNMLPVWPLDFSRALLAATMSRFDENKAERILFVVSDITTVLFTAFCVFYYIFISLNISLGAVCIYLILLNLKRRQTDVKQRY